MTTSGPLRASSSAPRRFPFAAPALTALAVVSILGTAGCAGADAEAPDAQTTQGAAPGTTSPDTPAPEAGGDAAPAGQAYRDGTYTQTGTYQSPAGPEDVGVTITLESDAVSGVEVEPMPDNPTTTEYQGRFAGGISEAIVGKKLDDLSVDKVAGSSLTSGGFNEAVGKIKSEAQL